MYVDTCNYLQNGKPRRRILLRTSYREPGKVKHKTIANLSSCAAHEIEAIRLALKHKNNLKTLERILSTSIQTQQGLSVGAVYALQETAKRLGLCKALGRSRPALLALWLVLARLIHQGSRLSAVRLAAQHAACDLLNLDAFNEDDLYSALDWLAQHQDAIEDRLFQERKKTSASQFFLYDVTSSYFEGQQNELADYGYNRDGKKGKKQIVIGLLTDEAGDPVSVQVYRGNTSDQNTFADQVRKVQERFGVQSVTMVGDRGMIKRTQIENLPASFQYITAITKPQIKTLLKQGVFQMELFDEDVCEVEWETVRYILRRNPVRAEEIAANRQEKLDRIQQEVSSQNLYLQEHPRAWSSTALQKVKDKIERLNLAEWLRVESEDRTLNLKVDEEKWQEISRLDGCYVIKTDIAAAALSQQAVHDRYKDLAQVEMAFRTMKTVLLETRPHYVRKESRTRGHVFAVMLAYKIVRHLKAAWNSLDLTVEEGIQELGSISSTTVVIGSTQYQTVPKPRPLGEQLLNALHLVLPEAIPSRGVNAATRKKLTPRR